MVKLLRIKYIRDFLKTFTCLKKAVANKGLNGTTDVVRDINVNTSNHTLTNCSDSKTERAVGRWRRR